MKKAILAALIAAGIFSEVTITSVGSVPGIWEPISNREYVRNYEPIKAAYTPREFLQTDAQALLKIAQAEAGNQGIEGMALVMEVVLNRTQKDGFPDTITGVIEEKGRFGTVTNGMYQKAEPSPEAHLALAMIESGKPFDTEIVGFEASANGRALEKYFDYVYTVGDHDFYVTKEVNNAQ